MGVRESAGQPDGNEVGEDLPAPREEGGVEYDFAPLLRLTTARAWSRLAELVVAQRREGGQHGPQDHQ